jgi:membrane fusion protein (multidrug efflux system)
MRFIMKDRWYCRICVLTLALAAAAGGGWSAFGEPAAAQSSRAGRPIPVQRCTVRLFDEVVLSFERPGILGEIPLREGDLVEEGQFLAKLKDDVARAALAVAEIEAASDVDIRYAQAASGVAQAEYQKMVETNNKVRGAVADIEVQKARLAFDKTVLEIEKATHTREVHMAKRDEAAAQLATFKLEAPFAGFVTKVYLSKGAIVRQGDPLIELVSTTKVKVEGYVAIRDLPYVKPGSKVNVHLDPKESGEEAAGKVFPGKIVFVDMKATPTLHDVRVWAEVENVDNALRANVTPAMTILPPASD